MKRFLIHVSTSWCGMDDTFRAMAENDYELDEIANQLAYENFQFYDCENDIAEEFGYDPDDMEDEDWDKLWEVYGFPAQAAMVVEECSELTNAICKFRRGRVGNDDIITEIADVMIMCEQLSYYFGKEKVELEKERKLERLKERLSKYTD